MSEALHQALSANRELVRQLADVRKAGDALAEQSYLWLTSSSGSYDGSLSEALTAYRNATTTKEPTK